MSAWAAMAQWAITNFASLLGPAAPYVEPIMKIVSLLAERRAVAEALEVEVTTLKTALELRRAWWSTDLKKTPSPPIQPLLGFHTLAFDNLATRLHVLDAPLLAKVLEFYGYMRFINDFHTMREFYDRDEEKRRWFYDAYDRLLEEEIKRADGLSLKTAAADARRDEDAFAEHLNAVTPP